MSSYSSLIQSFHQSAPDYCIDLPEGWLQGRTAFGGMTSALLLEALQHHYEDLPPLRTMQVNFIGPTAGPLHVTHKLLRRGKNNVTIEARLDSELGAGTYGYFTFGVARPLERTLDYPLRQEGSEPEDVPLMPPPVQGLSFLDNFERRFISGPELLSGTDNPDLLLWTRHVDPDAREGLAPLLVLGDGPPAALFALTKVRALSSMNWNVNMLTDDLTTEDGWWLMRSATGFVRDGYSSQLVQIWNKKGQRVLESMQHQAIFP